MLSRFDTILACDRQTDGQTDILRLHSPRYAYTSRGKIESFLKLLVLVHSGKFLPRGALQSAILVVIEMSVRHSV